MLDNLPGVENVITKDGECTLAQAIADYPLVAIYFSAHWCPPCKQFTPVLGQWYEEVNKDAKTCQIVFVTSDKDDAAFKAYYDLMPWVAVSFDGVDRQAIKQKHGVQGIPMIPVFKADGTKISDNARGDIHKS